MTAPRQLTVKEILEREKKFKEDLKENGERYSEEAIFWFKKLGILFMPTRFYYDWFERKRCERRQQDRRDGLR